MLTSEISTSLRNRPISNSSIKIQIRCTRARMGPPLIIRTEARQLWCSRATTLGGQTSSVCPITTTTGWASRSSRTSCATASTSSSRCYNHSKCLSPLHRASCISREAVKGTPQPARATKTRNRSIPLVGVSRFPRTRWPSLKIKVARTTTPR